MWLKAGFIEDQKLNQYIWRQWLEDYQEFMENIQQQN